MELFTLSSVEPVSFGAPPDSTKKKDEPPASEDVIEPAPPTLRSA